MLAIFVGAVGAGFFVSSSLGREVLRQELERQLARLMRSPVEIDRARLFVGTNGLQVEGHLLSTYRDDTGPQLSAEYAIARLDVASLAVGKLKLSRLYLEGAHLRTERSAEAEWSPAPIDHVARSGPGGRDDLEHRVRTLRAFEATARFFLERGLLASRLELASGRITFIDHRVRPGGEPLVFEFAEIEGTLVNSWITGETELSLRAYLMETPSGRTAIEAVGRRGSDGAIHLSLATRNLPIHRLEPYAKAALADSRLAGRLSGVVAVESPTRDHGRIELDWVLSDIDASVTLREDPIDFASERVVLRSEIELHPGRLRLASGEVAAPDMRLTASGVVDRPVRESSEMGIAASLEGAGLGEVEAFVAALPRKDRDALQGLVSRVQSGEIVRVGGGGRARLSIWRRLLAGQLLKLPEDFLLSAEVKEVVVGTSEVDLLTELRGVLDWRGDRIEIREANALWNGKPLPLLSASIDGLSHLLEAAESSPPLAREARRLPGLPALWELFGTDDDDDRPDLPVVRVELDGLHHPAIRWPLHDARLVVEPAPNGARLLINDGTWAGAPVSGEGSWVPEPEPMLSLDVRVGERRPELSVPPTPLAEGAWLSGRAHIGGVADIPFPYERFSGRFAVRGATLVLDDVRGDLLPHGQFSGSGEVELSNADVLGADIHFVIADGDIATLTEAVGFPPKFAEGAVELKGELAGEVVRHAPVMAGLVGTLDVSAGAGEVSRSLPVITVVASLSEGLVIEDVVRFQGIESVIEFDHGLISTPRFALDGPMRLVASGSFDPYAQQDSLAITVGIFLMRQLDQVLDRLPLIKHLTDSDKGLFGVYFALTGTWEEPLVEALPVKTIAQGNLLTQLAEAPLRMLKELESFLGAEAGEPRGPRSPSPLGRKGARRLRETPAGGRAQ